MEQYEFDEMIENFENQCAELKVHFPEGYVEAEAYRGCKWGVPSDKIRVEVPLTKKGSDTMDVDVGEALPRMFGVFRNYNGGGINGGMCKSDLDQEEVIATVKQSLEDYTGKKANPKQLKRCAQEVIQSLSAYLDLCVKYLYAYEEGVYDIGEPYLGHDKGVLIVK